MSATPDLECKKLAGADLELLAGLLDAPVADREGFGLVTGSGLGEPWGAFVHGCLCGAAWLRLNLNGDQAEITALLVSKRWSNIGIGSLLLGRLAQAAGATGAEKTRIRLTSGGLEIAATLEDAGFSGPDPESADYPAGAWYSRSSAPRPWA